jgi:hypothetical protein
LENLINTLGATVTATKYPGIWSEWLLWWFPGQVRIWVTCVKKLAHTVLICKNLVYTIEATVVIQITWKLFRKVVLVISRSNFNMGYLWSKTKSHSPNKMGLSLHNQVRDIRAIMALLFQIIAIGSKLARPQGPLIFLIYIYTLQPLYNAYVGVQCLNTVF